MAATEKHSKQNIYKHRVNFKSTCAPVLNLALKLVITTTYTKLFSTAVLNLALVRNVSGSTDSESQTSIRSDFILWP